MLIATQEYIHVLICYFIAHCTLHPPRQHSIYHTNITPTFITLLLPSSRSFHFTHNPPLPYTLSTSPILPFHFSHVTQRHTPLTSQTHPSLSPRLTLYLISISKHTTQLPLYYFLFIFTSSATLYPTFTPPTSHLHEYPPLLSLTFSSPHK